MPVDEASKTKAIWGDLERSIIRGQGIDIGCGPDPIAPDVRRFDMEDGDANRITEFVDKQFDYVFSSHCLEHMHDPRLALREWWKLVRPGGHLVFLVPDEDLYEQGVFPSRFNPDHKATFTLSKARSWSPVSHNVLDLTRMLPDAELVSLALHDHGYDRSAIRFGPIPEPRAIPRFLLRVYRGFRRRGLAALGLMERLERRYQAVDQTLKPNTLAQIQCILRKRQDLATTA
jgi:SAM-dependent methyltransferase